MVAADPARPVPARALALPGTGAAPAWRRAQHALGPAQAAGGAGRDRNQALRAPPPALRVPPDRQGRSPPARAQGPLRLGRAPRLTVGATRVPLSPRNDDIAAYCIGAGSESS